MRPLLFLIVQHGQVFVVILPLDAVALHHKGKLFFSERTHWFHSVSPLAAHT